MNLKYKVQNDFYKTHLNFSQLLVSLLLDGIYVDIN